MTRPAAPGTSPGTDTSPGADAPKAPGAGTHAEPGLGARAVSGADPNTAPGPDASAAPGADARVVWEAVGFRAEGAAGRSRGGSCTCGTPCSGTVPRSRRSACGRWCRWPRPGWRWARAWTRSGGWSRRTRRCVPASRTPPVRATSGRTSPPRVRIWSRCTSWASTPRTVRWPRSPSAAAGSWPPSRSGTATSGRSASASSAAAAWVRAVTLVCSHVAFDAWSADLVGTALRLP